MTLSRLLLIASAALALAGEFSVFTKVYFFPQLNGILLTLLFSLIAKDFFRQILIFSASLLISFFTQVFSHSSLLNLDELYFLVGISIFWGFSLLDKEDQRAISCTIVGISIFQAILAVFQRFGYVSFGTYNLLPLGTVGNSEFLATLLSIGLLLHFQFFSKRLHQFTISSILVAGIIATGSKGTVLILFGFFISKVRNKLIMAPLALATIAGIVLYFKSSSVGRLWLWRASWHTYLEHPWLGIPLGTFSNSYLEATYDLFLDPTTRTHYGGWTSEVSDAHNIFLNWGVSFGILGIIAAVVLVLYSIRTALMTSLHQKMELLLLVIKSLYNVVLGSIQGLFLWSLLLCPSRSRVKPFERPLVVSLVGFLIPLTLNLALADFNLRKGMLDLRASLPDMAIVSLNKAMDLAPGNRDTQLALAFAYMLKKDCERAQNFVSLAIDNNFSMDAYKRGGHILFECEKLKEARILFRRLHFVFPEHRTTTIKLAWIALKLKDFEEAYQLSSEVLKSNPRRKSYSDEKNLKDARIILDLSSRHLSNRNL